MFVKIKIAFKEVKQHMDKKIQMYKEMLASRQNRLVAGVVLGGLSLGLIASAYIPYPA